MLPQIPSLDTPEDSLARLSFTSKLQSKGRPVGKEAGRRVCVGVGGGGELPISENRTQNASEDIGVL